MDLSRDLEALSANLSDLLGQHFKVVRLEVLADLHQVMKRAVFLLVVIPFVIGGFILLTQAAIGLLARWWPPENVVGALGLLYLLIAGLAVMRAKQPVSPPLLSESARELSGTVHALKDAAKGAR